MGWQDGCQRHSDGGHRRRERTRKGDVARQPRECSLRTTSAPSFPLPLPQMPELQRDLHQRLRAEALANHTRLAAVIRPLEPEQIVRRPAPGAWSVGEALEHLCIADELYAKPLATLIHRARVDAGAPLREWKPSFLGRMIAGTLSKPKPMKTPKAMRPGPTPRNGVVEDFLTRDRRLIQRMDEAASLDWRELRVHPPMIPVPFVTINLGDVFNIHVVHVHRHMGQIERAIASSR